MSHKNLNKSDAIHMDQNDDAPMEVPISKKPISSQSAKSRFATQKEWRDPRFDRRVGEFDPVLFAKHYSFVDDLRSEELNKLKKALKKTNNVERRSEIQNSIVRIQNKFVAKKEDEKKRDVVKELSSKKKFVKKSDVKKELLVQKFHELKKSGKLTRYMQRKRKKLINKDGKMAFV